jgi:ribosomal protein S18 acetylase RimI-like enzyme
LRDAIIRPARLEDAEALRQNCYPDHNPDDVRDYLAWCLRQAEKGWIVRLVAEVEGQTVGNVQLTIWGEDGEIGSLCVGKEYRRRGLARHLLTELIDVARQRGLAALEISVSESQPKILAFYQRLGFHLIRDSQGEGPDKKSGLFHSARPGFGVQLRMLL